MSKTKSPGAVTALGASKIDALGRHVVSETNIDQISEQDPIHATLIGEDRCEAEGIVVRASAPVLALCRRLIAAGYNPATPLEAWRGDALALRVASIGVCVRLRVATHGVGFETVTGRTGAAPARQNAPEIVEQRSNDARVRDAPPETASGRLS